MKKNLDYFIALDRQFLNDIQTLGSEGWIKHMADDIVAAQVNYLNIGEGKELVSKSIIEHYKTEGIYYNWESSNFEISADHTLFDYISKYYFHETINGKQLQYEGVFSFTWKLVGEEYKLSKMIAAWKS